MGKFRFIAITFGFSHDLIKKGGGSTEKIFTVVVCGPTASGKTKLAVDLALEFGGEIVSADSMQIYKGMDIASAKPTEEEKQGVPHHLMDFLEPTEAFSVADYVILARKAIAEIHERGRLPIICGGTGLYINSLIDNIEFDDTGSDPEYREQLRQLAEEKGGTYLLEMLRTVDPENGETALPGGILREASANPSARRKP